MKRRGIRAFSMTPLESGDPAGTSQRLELDFRHRRILKLVATGPVFDSDAPDEVRERVARWIEMTAASEEN
jgi:hypothetical protein